MSSPERENEIRRFVKRYYILNVLAGLAIGAIAVIVGWVYALALGIIYFAWYFLQMRRLVSGLPTTTANYTREEILNKMAQAYSIGALWFFEVVSLIVLLGSAWQLITRQAIWWALLSVIIMGACCGLFAYMIGVKKKLKPSTKNLICLDRNSRL